MIMTDIEKKYKDAQEARKAKIRQEPNKVKRFFKWCWFACIFPWVWAWSNLRDWKTWIIFLIVMAIYSGSVWGFYVAGALCGWTSTTAGKWCIGIGSSVWAWWLSPIGSPFILLSVGTTIGVKAIFNKIKDRRNDKKKSKSDQDLPN